MQGVLLRHAHICQRKSQLPSVGRCPIVSLKHLMPCSGLCKLLQASMAHTQSCASPVHGRTYSMGRVIRLDRSLERQHGLAGLLSSRRLRAVPSIRAASGPGNRDPARPSAPPLPQELRTGERVNYPEVYQGSDYAAGQPGSREDQVPIDESVFATDQVQVTSQSQTEFQRPLLGHVKQAEALPLRELAHNACSG